MARTVQFTQSSTSGGRIHYLQPEDVLTLLDRLPADLYERLTRVHFNDCALGNRRLGYVTRGRDEITICALPVNVSLGRLCVRPRIPACTFGAPARGQWPSIAVRRCMLYDVFLHELGHLQMINPRSKSIRRQYAGERKAQEFANRWRESLWSTPFDHPDPVHNPPAEEELRLIDRSNHSGVLLGEQAVSKAAPWGSNPRAVAVPMV